jgi:hypothetical protein
VQQVCMRGCAAKRGAEHGTSVRMGVELEHLDLDPRTR